MISARVGTLAPENLALWDHGRALLERDAALDHSYADHSGVALSAPANKLSREDGRRYVLISPSRDEAAYMRQTLDSVIAQSVRPARWIIVDDGSTDETPHVLAEYCRRYDWITVVRRENRGRRSVGPGVIEAFYAGYAVIDPNQYDFVCKLDLDLRLPPRYFEILLQRMAADRRIATCSGKAYVQKGGELINERHGDDTSLGMTKFYRVS